MQSRQNTEELPEYSRLTFNKHLSVKHCVMIHLICFYQYDRFFMKSLTYSNKWNKNAKFPNLTIKHLNESVRLTKDAELWCMCQKKYFKVSSRLLSM